MQRTRRSASLTTESPAYSPMEAMSSSSNAAVLDQMRAEGAGSQSLTDGGSFLSTEDQAAEDSMMAWANGVADSNRQFDAGLDELDRGQRAMPAINNLAKMAGGPGNPIVAPLAVMNGMRNVVDGGTQFAQPGLDNQVTGGFQMFGGAAGVTAGVYGTEALIMGATSSPQGAAIAGGLATGIATGNRGDRAAAELGLLGSNVDGTPRSLSDALGDDMASLREEAGVAFKDTCLEGGEDLVTGAYGTAMSIVLTPATAALGAYGFAGDLVNMLPGFGPEAE